MIILNFEYLILDEFEILEFFDAVIVNTGILEL